MKKIIILFLIAFSINSKAQETKQFGVGMYYGFRFNSGCLFINYNLSERLAFTGEFGIDKFHGLGIGISTCYYLFPYKALIPLLEINYSRTFGGLAGYGDNGGNPTIIKVSDANFIIPKIGVRFNSFFKDSIKATSLSLIFKIGYKFSNSIHPKVSYIYGPIMLNEMSRINKYVDNGIIASLGFIYNLPRKKK